jgi:hypothetical protein
LEIEISQAGLMAELRKGFVNREPLRFEPEYKSTNKKKKKTGQGRRKSQAHQGRQADKHSGSQGGSTSNGQARNQAVSITDEERDYLNSIIEHSNCSVSNRGKSLFGFSSNKSNAIKKDLIQNRLIQEFSVSLGRAFGGTVKMLRLTLKGYLALGIKPPKQYSKLQGSLEHIWWQENIAMDYRGKGYKAIIEQELNEKAVDVGVEKNNELVAVEIELTPNNAVYNFRADIDVGFSRVFIACKNNNVKRIIEKQLQIFLANNIAYMSKSKVVLLSEFPFVKKLHNEIKGI